MPKGRACKHNCAKLLKRSTNMNSITLRYAENGDIDVPSHRTDLGLRYFVVAGFSSWNALHVGLRSSSISLETFAIAKHLKTHLKGIAYS